MIQWGLVDPNAFQRGFENAKRPFDEFAEAQKKNALDAALRDYATNPNDPNAVNALAQVDPRLAIQVRQQQQTMQAKSAEDYRDSIKAGGEIIRRIQSENPQMPKEQVYSVAREAAIRMRIPGADQAPAQFDEQYFNTLLYAADPPKSESSPYQAVAGQPGAGVYRFNRATGTMEVLVQPNDGTQPVGAPATQAPTVDQGIATVTDQSTYEAVPPGEKYRDPSGKIRIKPAAGGPTPRASGGFP